MGGRRVLKLGNPFVEIFEKVDHQNTVFFELTIEFVEFFS
ncbi:MAG: hypothetical protein ACI89J_002649 [Hyphomicrobiaceae bacterium]